MRIGQTSSSRPVTFDEEGKIIPSDRRFLNQYLTDLDSDIGSIFKLSQGQITYGLSSNLRPGQNIFGQWVTVADTGAANTEFIVPHSLSSETIVLIPGNYFVTNINKGGVVYTSGTTWTTSNVYFKCSAANAAVTIFLTR